MPILRAIWTCFEHVQTAMTCVQTLYYSLKMLRPSSSYQHGYPMVNCNRLPKILLLHGLIQMQIKVIEFLEHIIGN